MLASGCERENTVPQQHADDFAAGTSSDTSSVEVGLEIILIGHLVSTACYADAISEDQRNTCAIEKTRQGFPVAVIEHGAPAQKAWILLMVPQIFMDYMGRTVRVQGVVRGDGVLAPLRVELEEADGWTFIM